MRVSANTAPIDWKCIKPFLGETFLMKGDDFVNKARCEQRNLCPAQGLNHYHAALADSDYQVEAHQQFWCKNSKSEILRRKAQRRKTIALSNPPLPSPLFAAKRHG